MAVTRPLGMMTLIPSVTLLLLKEPGAGQPPEGIHKEQELVLFFFLERVGKAAAACCDQGSSNRARAPFSLEQENSTSGKGKVTNETPGRALLKSSRSRIGPLQILGDGLLFPGLQSCFWGYFLSGKAESHDTKPDSAWHALTHLSELTDCQPK